MRVKSLALTTPKSFCPSFLSVEGTDQVKVLYLEDLKIKLRILLELPCKQLFCVFAKRYQKCRYSSILRKENDFNLKVLK